MQRSYADGGAGDKRAKEDRAGTSLRTHTIGVRTKTIQVILDAPVPVWPLGIPNLIFKRKKRRMEDRNKGSRLKSGIFWVGNLT